MQITEPVQYTVVSSTRQQTAQYYTSLHFHNMKNIYHNYNTGVTKITTEYFGNKWIFGEQELTMTYQTLIYHALKNKCMNVDQEWENPFLIRIAYNYFNVLFCYFFYSR